MEIPPSQVVEFNYIWKKGINKLHTYINPLRIYEGTGSPEGVVTANIGALYINLSGGASTTLYVKESTNGANTGWVAK